MTDLHELARLHIEAAAAHTPDLARLRLRASTLRRRRRMLRSTALAGVAGLVVALGVVATQEPTRLDTAGRPALDDPALTVQRIEARGGEMGTSEVTIVFDGPLPIDEVATTDTVEGIDPQKLVVAVQDPGPGAVEVCGTKHWFPESPDGSGSVDLLIPASWLIGDPPQIPAVTTLQPPPDKIITCGPYRGHVQISIWGAAPTATERLDVALSDDRTRIVLQTAPSDDPGPVIEADDIRAVTQPIALGPTETLHPAVQPEVLPDLTEMSAAAQATLDRNPEATGPVVYFGLLERGGAVGDGHEVIAVRLSGITVMPTAVDAQPVRSVEVSYYDAATGEALFIQQVGCDPAEGCPASPA